MMLVVVNVPFEWLVALPVKVATSSLTTKEVCKLFNTHDLFDPMMSDNVSMFTSEESIFFLLSMESNRSPQCSIVHWWKW